MLKERLKPLLKDSFVYGITGGIAKFFALITLPIIVNHLSSSEYGIYTMIQILLTVASSVVVFGMDSAVVFCLDDFASAPLERKKSVFTNALFFQFVLSLFSVVALYYFSEEVLSAFNISTQYTSGYHWSILSLPLFVFFLFMQSWFKWTFRKVDYLIQIIGYTVLNLLGLFIATVFFKLTVTTVIAINFLSLLVVMTIGVYRSRGLLLKRINLKETTMLVKYGFPMMIVMLLGVLISSVDRFFLSKYVSNAAIGVYSFGQRISLITVMFITAFQIAFGPFFVSIWNKKDAQSTFAKFQTYYIILVGTIALGVCSVSKIIITLINPEYLGSEKILPFLISGAFIYGLYSFSGIGIYYSKKSYLNLLTLVLSFAGICLVDFLFTKQFLTYAVCAGFLFGNCVLVVSGYIISRKFYPVNYQFKIDLTLMFCFFSLIASNYYTFHTSIYIDAFIHLAISSIGFLLISFYLLSHQERAKAIHYLAKIPAILKNPKEFLRIIK